MSEREGKAGSFGHPSASPLRGETILSCRDLRKTFTIGKQDVPVLKGINLDVQRGERIAIVGASGSGKSTLLHLLGGLDNASGGSVQILGQDMQKMDETQRGEMRNRSLGFVYQFHHLLPEFSAWENVAMPALIAGQRPAEAMTRALQLLEDVGLRDRASMRPPKLSGGEQQRVAVARALMNSPAVVLADEPSGNLDTVNAQALHALIWDLSRKRGQTFVVVTHNEALARQSDRVAKIADGVVQAG